MCKFGEIFGGEPDESQKQERRAQLWQSTKSTKVEFHSEVILGKIILDLMQYWLKKDHQLLKLKQHKSWIFSPYCILALDKKQTMYLLKPKCKRKMFPNFSKFQNRNVQTFGIVYHGTNGLNFGPVWETQSFLLTEICMVILWQDCCGRGSLRKSCSSTTVGTKFPIGNAYSYTVKKGYSYLCVWMT